MKNNLKNIFIPLGIVTVLSGCATAPEKTLAPVNDPIKEAEAEISRLMQEIATHSVQKHSFKPVSHCRYEITTHWHDFDKGYYHAQSSQRFSFTYDLRNIERTPAYSLQYKDGMQHWDEMLDLTFNRMVPTRFTYIKTDDFESKHRDSLSDAFSLSGYADAPRPLMNQLLGAFELLAQLCGANIAQFDDVKTKLQGRWELFGLEKTQGALIVTKTEAGLLTADNQTLEGSYQLETQGDYHRMSIMPKDGGAPYYLLLDFVNSNYARVVLLGKEPGPVPFAPIWSEDKSQHNPDELKLFRKGDLR